MTDSEDAQAAAHCWVWNTAAFQMLYKTAEASSGGRGSSSSSSSSCVSQKYFLLEFSVLDRERWCDNNDQRFASLVLAV